jgi:GTPase SAR1 family protein
VKRWKKKVEEECGTIPMVLVQNKMDLLYNSAVDRYLLSLHSKTVQVHAH